MQDSILIQGLRNMDQEMFRELVNRYQQPLMRLCRGFLHNEEDARDMTQEIFLEVVKSIHNFRGNARLSTWLYRIAVNKCLNQIRTNKIRNTFIIFDPLQLTEKKGNHYTGHTEGSGPDTNIEKADRRKHIRKALDSLPANQKIALILNKYMDLTYKEISEIMDVSVPAVESLIHRAKTRLQDKLFRLYRKNLL